MFLLIFRDAIAAEEKAEYERESKLSEEAPVKPIKVEVRPKRNNRRGQAAYKTRATRELEDDDENEEVI